MAKKDGRYRRKVARPGWYVAEWLIYLGMQQTDLIQGTGRTKSRISELVSGKQRWNEDDLAMFSRVMGVNRLYLLDVNPLTPEGAKHAEAGRVRPPPAAAPPPSRETQKRT